MVLENQEYTDPNEEIKAIEKKLALMFGVITAVLTVLVASIVVLLKWDWWFVLGSGFIIGIGMASMHNWLGARMALKYNLEISYSAMERVFRQNEEKQPQTSVVVYVEPPVRKDPRYHTDDPRNYK